MVATGHNRLQVVLLLRDRTSTATATVHQPVATATEVPVFSGRVRLGCSFFSVGATGPSKTRSPGVPLHILTQINTLTSHWDGEGVWWSWSGGLPHAAASIVTSSLSTKKSNNTIRNENQSEYNSTKTQMTQSSFGPVLHLLLLLCQPLFSVVAPSPSLLCQLLVSTPPTGAHNSGMGVGVPSWHHLMVNNIDKT